MARLEGERIRDGVRVCGGRRRGRGALSLPVRRCDAVPLPEATTQKKKNRKKKLLIFIHFIIFKSLIIFASRNFSDDITGYKYGTMVKKPMLYIEKFQ